MSNYFTPFGNKAVFGEAEKLAAGRRKTIHIVDDMADGMHFVAIAVGQAGYSAFLHGSFGEFAKEFRKESAQAIFLDARLGDADATDVLDFLRNCGSLAEIYLIGSDADALECMRRYAEEIGLSIVEEVAKPFTGKQLIDLVERRRTAFSDVIEQIDIAEGVRKGWLYPVLQPKVDLASGKIGSAEILTRIAHPDYGIISAQSFVGQLSAAQSKALFMENVAFGRRHWGFDPDRTNDFRININIDVQNLVAIYDDLRVLSARTPLFFRNLVFELTEERISLLEGNQLKALFKLSLAGAKFSIDDFGVGHSNFSRLSRLPIYEIKIDRSIIQGCASLQKRQVIIKSIVGMARDLGVRVVAEGVETFDDLAWLEEIRCDEVQGFLIARPMKLDRFRRFIKEFGTSGWNARTESRT